MTYRAGPCDRWRQRSARHRGTSHDIGRTFMIILEPLRPQRVGCATEPALQQRSSQRSTTSRQCLIVKATGSPLPSSQRHTAWSSTEHRQRRCNHHPPVVLSPASQEFPSADQMFGSRVAQSTAGHNSSQQGWMSNQKLVRTAKLSHTHTHTLATSFLVHTLQPQEPIPNHIPASQHSTYGNMAVCTVVTFLTNYQKHTNTSMLLACKFHIAH